MASLTSKPAKKRPAKKVPAKRSTPAKKKAPVKKSPARRKAPVKRKAAPKKAVGRPTKMTATTVKKLEEAFLLGCTDLEACLYAGISKQTLYNYQEQTPEFIDRKEMLKTNPVMKARKVILDALADDDRNIANRLIERKEGSKVAVTGADGGALQIEHVIPEDADPREAGQVYASWLKGH